MGRRGVIALILLATFACGCSGGGGKPDSGVAPGDAWAEIGTGTVDFVELADEADLALIAGPQGGHHFIVHARMHGLEPGDPAMPGTTQNPRTEFTVWSESGDRLDIAPPPYQLGYEEVTDGVYALASGRIIQVVEEQVAAMYGARVRVRVEVTDAAGATVADERWVVAVEEGGDPQADAGPPPAWVEIGYADASDTTIFLELPAEGDLVVHEGIQGGHHFFLHARMMGLAPEDAITRFRVYDEGGDRVDASGNVPLDYEDAGGGTYVLPLAPQTVLNEPDVDAILDTRVRVTVELTDTDGVEVTDERWVTAVAP